MIYLKIHFHLSLLKNMNYLFARMGSGSMEPSVEGDDNSKTHSIRQKNTQNALPSAAVQSTAKASKMTLSFNVSSLILIALSSALSLTQRRIPILPNIILVSQS